MKTKVCTKCGKRKKLEAFARCRRHSDGRQTYCRQCKAALAKALYARPEKRAAALKRSQRWVAANRARINARARARRKANPEQTRAYNRKRADYRRAWYFANRARTCVAERARYMARRAERLAYSKRWHLANRERVQAYKAKWYQANRDWANWSNAQAYILRGGI